MRSCSPRFWSISPSSTRAICCLNSGVCCGRTAWWFFSTPNVCNVSNVVSLLKGNNIFWDSDIFYGDTDRHNREFTPREVRSLFESNGFVTRAYFGMNDHANWRSGSAQHLYDYQAIYGTPEHGLMRNTIVGVFGKASG